MEQSWSLLSVLAGDYLNVFCFCINLLDDLSKTLKIHLSASWKTCLESAGYNGEPKTILTAGLTVSHIGMAPPMLDPSHPWKSQHTRWPVAHGGGVSLVTSLYIYIYCCVIWRSLFVFNKFQNILMRGRLWFEQKFPAEHVYYLVVFDETWMFVGLAYCDKPLFYYFSYMML